jgi:hypothetical protein
MKKLLKIRICVVWCCRVLARPERFELSLNQRILLFIQSLRNRTTFHGPCTDLFYTLYRRFGVNCCTIHNHTESGMETPKMETPKPVELIKEEPKEPVHEEEGCPDCNLQE